ncbi:unnamed protein product [Clonostachys solani]|uniref:Uncharacterized protein n=1 Tax=Clonostachys solani TaxID=160281 RepID=A0A9N9ZGF8_9HYPO|nr:unnamed protein product [Clonostachys solani]
MWLYPKIEGYRPIPKEVYTLRTYLFAAISSTCGATIGHDSVFIGGALSLRSFKDEFKFESISDDEVNVLTANIISYYQADAFFGAIFAYLGGHYLGNRPGLLIFAILFSSHPPAVRGRLVGIWEIGWQSGGLVGFWINQWFIPFAVQLVPAGILIIAAILTDESPRWLMSNGKREQGIKVLARLRNLAADHP